MYNEEEKEKKQFNRKNISFSKVFSIHNTITHKTVKIVSRSDTKLRKWMYFPLNMNLYRHSK